MGEKAAAARRAELDGDIRARLIEQPELILDDIEMMRALMAANDRARGGNVVDLRGVAMDRLEARLDRLEDTHRAVIAAAYENLAGTNQIHRAILRMLDPTSFEDFVAGLSDDVAAILQVEAVRLVLEAAGPAPDASLARLGEVLVTAEPGFCAGYMDVRGDRPVVLRRAPANAAAVYGAHAGGIRSEACIALDLGQGRRPAMLALGSDDPHQFAPSQGTDLLTFFGGVFERTLRSWLS